MVIFTQLIKNLILLGLVTCLLGACMVPDLIPPQESELSSETVMLTTETHQTLFSLPAPLFYLGDGQVWRLSPDTHAKQQITSESAPIEAFDVSPVDGRLAYISKNSLIIAGPDGGDREVLRVGPELPLFSDELARFNDIEQITSTIRTPLWSPDGQKIAFINNGLQVYDLERNQTEQLWDHSNPSNERILLDSLLSWSPNGQYFLVDQYAYPLESVNQVKLGLLKPGAFLNDLGEKDSATFTWNPDETSLYIANTSFGDPSSLKRCDLANFSCTNIAEFEPARWYYHYAYPFVTAEDRLMVFMGATNEDSQAPATFKLISLNLDGSDRRSLQSNGYNLAFALWSPQGDGVLISLAQDSGPFHSGSLVWLSTSDQAPISLPVENGNNFRWGLSIEP
jgi:hypothetical protein